MSYLDFTPAIAERLAQDNPWLTDSQKPTWAQVRDTWKVLELWAKKVAYDVLYGDLQMDELSVYCVIGDTVQKMIGYLYLLEDTPMAAAVDDVTHLKKADLSYGSSWMKRGGQGAFFVTCRKFDRIEQQMKGMTELDAWLHNADEYGFSGDGPWGDIRDLRRYLLLWLSERARDNRYAYR